METSWPRTQMKKQKHSIFTCTKKKWKKKNAFQFREGEFGVSEGYTFSDDEESYCPKLEAWRNRFERELKRFIEDDKKHEFVKLLRSQSDIAHKYFDEAGHPLSFFVLDYCLRFCALNCTEALLGGETGVTLNLDKLGSTPLHRAAISLSPKLTKYCLKSGWHCDGKDDHGLQPLDYALLGLRNRVFWTREQSLYSLIFELTGEGMIEPTQTMRLLIENTSESNVSEIICRYGTEAKIVELAMLLIVSTDIKHIRVDNLYMPSNDVSSVDQLTLRQFVVNEIVMLENKLRNVVVVGSYNLAQCREMKKSMMSTLMLLEIFQRTGPEIGRAVRRTDQTYPSTADAIGRVFECSDFKLSSQETSYLLKSSFKLDLPADRVQPISEERLPGLHSYSLSGVPELDSFETMPNFGWDETDPEHQKLLPMHTTIEKLSSSASVWQWKPNESIFKLVMMLFLLKMRETWGIASSLAQSSEKFNEIACCYAKEGKLIELSIILMLAREKVMRPIVFQIRGEKSHRSMTFLQFVNSELAQAIDLECRLTGRKTKLEEELKKLCKQRKLVMVSALGLLEIFEKAGAALQTYFWSERGNVQKEKGIKEVSVLLSEAGFNLKEDVELHDPVDSWMEVEQQNEALQDPHTSSGMLQGRNTVDEMATERGCQMQHLTRLSYVLPCGFVETHGSCGRPNDMRSFLFTRYPRECFSLPSGAQSFRAFWTSKDSKASYFTGFPKALEVQGGAVRGVNSLMQKFPASKRFASVALAVKKHISRA